MYPGFGKETLLRPGWEEDSYALLTRLLLHCNGTAKVVPC